MAAYRDLRRTGPSTGILHRREHRGYRPDESFGVSTGAALHTVVHDLDAKRILFATEGRDHQTVVEFAADLKVGALPPVKGHRAAQPFITVRGCLAVK